MLSSTIRHRELIMRLVKRDLKVRYKASSLGFLWSVAKPLLLVLVYAIVFDKVLQLKLPNASELNFGYSLFIMAGLLPWIFFSTSVAESMYVILNNANLVKKVRLPLEVFPLSTVIGNLIHFLLAMIVVLIFIFACGIRPSAPMLLFPLIVLLETLLAIGFALMLSALNVFYRDIASAFEVIFTAWMYGTPIIYSVDLAARAFGLGGGTGHLPSWLFNLYMLNPMAPIVLAYRRILLYSSPQGAAHVVPVPEYAAFANDGWLMGWLGVSAIVTILLLVGGWLIFQRYSRSFADEV